jgi:hypothetical protein
MKTIVTVILGAMLGMASAQQPQQPQQNMAPPQRNGQPMNNGAINPQEFKMLQNQVRMLQQEVKKLEGQRGGNMNPRAMMNNGGQPMNNMQRTPLPQQPMPSSNPMGVAGGAYAPQMNNATGLIGGAMAGAPGGQPMQQPMNNVAGAMGAAMGGQH